MSNASWRTGQKQEAEEGARKAQWHTERKEGGEERHREAIGAKGQAA